MVWRTPNFEGREGIEIMELSFPVLYRLNLATVNFNDLKPPTVRYTEWS